MRGPESFKKEVNPEERYVIKEGEVVEIIKKMIEEKNFIENLI